MFWVIELWNTFIQNISKITVITNIFKITFFIYILKYNVLFNQNDQNIYCHYSLKSLFFFPQCHYHNFIPRFSSHFKQNKHSIISCKMYLVVILKQFRNLVDMICIHGWVNTWIVFPLGVKDNGPNSICAYISHI